MKTVHTWTAEADFVVQAVPVVLLIVPTFKADCRVVAKENVSRERSVLLSCDDSGLHVRGVGTDLAGVFRAEVDQVLKVPDTGWMVSIKPARPVRASF